MDKEDLISWSNIRKKLYFWMRKQNKYTKSAMQNTIKGIYSEIRNTWMWFKIFPYLAGKIIMVNFFCFKNMK